MMGDRLADKVFTFTAEKRLFTAPCHVLVGVSGGADSMALLHLLMHWPTSGMQVSAVHIHHGLRGEAADSDERFVRHYCQEHGVPLTVFRADVAAMAEEKGLSLEEAGRRARYERFETLCGELHADYIVTAHTASDQTETVLMHLIRGCSVDGLCGIPAMRGRIRRPLLCVNRQEVEEYCNANNIPYITDETNGDTRYTRNDIRHRVLPMLRQMNPSVDDALLRLRSCAAEDAAYLNRLAEDASESARRSYGYDADVFVSQPMVVRRRMIRRLLLQAGVPTFEEAHIVAADEALMHRSGSVSLPDGYVFSVQQGTVMVRHNEERALPADVFLDTLPCSVVFDGRAIECFVEQNRNVHKLFENCVIDYGKIQGTLRLRCRQTGDYFHPAGRGVGKSVKKLMNEWHIPSPMRDYYPLVCDDMGIVLIPGYACDERVRVDDDTKHFLVCKTDAEQG